MKPQARLEWGQAWNPGLLITIYHLCPIILPFSSSILMLASSVYTLPPPHLCPLPSPPTPELTDSFTLSSLVHTLSSPPAVISPSPPILLHPFSHLCRCWVLLHPCSPPLPACWLSGPHSNVFCSPCLSPLCCVFLLSSSLPHSFPIHAPTATSTRTHLSCVHANKLSSCAHCLDPH